MSLLGSAILLICLPFLVLFHDKDSSVNQFLTYTPTLCVILSSSSGFIGGLSISLILGRKPSVRNFIHGPVAGAIIGGASSYFTTNLAWCLGIGLFGGCLQTGVQHIFERRITFHHRPFTTISFSLFGVQGFLAGCFSAIGKEIVEKESLNLNYTRLGYNSGNLFLFGLVSSAMGFSFGLLIGSICYFTHSNLKREYFNDKSNWTVMKRLDEKAELISSAEQIGSKYKYPRPVSF